MQSKTSIKFDSISFALFYSQITFALTAARIIKSMALQGTRMLTETEEYLIRFTQAEMISNAAKIWDKQSNSLNIERFVNNLAIPDSEKLNIEAELSKIKIKYAKTIKDNLEWRHNLGSHLNRKINSSRFNQFSGEVRDLQAMLREILYLVENISIFPEDRITKILDYSQICIDLNLWPS
jgi:hypothetical protein